MKQFTNAKKSAKLTEETFTPKNNPANAGTTGSTVTPRKTINPVINRKIPVAIPLTAQKTNSQANGISRFLSADKNDTASKPVKITEKLEQKRISKATNSSIFRFVPEERIPAINKLKEKRTEDYYKLTKNNSEDNKRLKELFGARTDFSISNVENNYHMLNSDEQALLTAKTQSYLNRNGYTDKEGFSLKEDGVFGPKTKAVYEAYKKDMGYEAPEQKKTLPDGVLGASELIASPLELSGDIALKIHPISDDNKTSDTRISSADSDNFDALYDKIKNNNNLLDNTPNSSSKNPNDAYSIDNSLSKQSKKLYDFASSYANSSKKINSEEYHSLLNECSNDNEMRGDIFQYGVMKMLRSIKNFENCKISEMPKYWSVMNYVMALLKSTVYYDNNDAKEMTNIIKEAIDLTTTYDAKYDNEKVYKAWFKVYTESCKKKYKAGKAATAGQHINADEIDYGINYIIDSFNCGISDGDVYQNINGVIEKIYDDVSKTYYVHGKDEIISFELDRKE